MDDLISTLSELRSNYSCFDHAERKYYHALSEAIRELKSVQKGRKMGKWRDHQRSRWDGTTYWFRTCTLCGYEREDDDQDKDSNFCPNCGADMR